jgi:tRNA threonylcarbamoyladenosine biosynthesis protein TsaE
MTVIEAQLPDAAATESLGARLAVCCREGLLVFLKGELGAGKTTLVRGLLRALGHSGTVKSPTYTLVESYQWRQRQVHHLDLYRLTDAEELEWMGLRDLLAEDALCLIEWPERGETILPDPDLEISLAYLEQGRRAVLTAFTDAGVRVADCLEQDGSPVKT